MPNLYRFSPLTKSGSVMGLKGRQFILGVVLILLAMIALSGFNNLWFGIIFIIAIPALWWIPIGERSLSEVLFDISSYGFKLITGKTIQEVNPWIDPPDLNQIGEDHVGNSGTWGRIPNGDNQWRVAMKLEASDFGLLDHQEQDQILQKWGSILAGLGGDPLPIKRCTWIESSSPASSGDPQRWFDLNAKPRTKEAAQDYQKLLCSVANSSTEHRTILVLDIEPEKTKKGDPKAIVIAEAEHLARRLNETGFTARPLSIHQIASETEAILRPLSRQGQVSAYLANKVRTPRLNVSVKEEADKFRLDNYWARTFWINEWPRISVFGSFLSPLLSTRLPATRVMAVEIKPIPNWKAIRKAEVARTNMGSDQKLRARFGFSPKLRLQREYAASEAREHDLISGHSALKFSGFILLVANSETNLENASRSIRAAGHQSQLSLNKLLFRQFNALNKILPISIPIVEKLRSEEKAKKTEEKIA